LINKLFFMAAVLVLAFVNAGIRSAAFGQTGSDAIACDIGPNYTGPIPGPAQEAGFTHCVANYDFTTAMFADPATWLDVCGASSPLLFMRNYGVNAPCDDVTMVDDTANGGASQVLALTYTVPADFNNNVAAVWLGTSSGINDPYPAGLYIYQGFYIEAVTRVTSDTATTSCGPTNTQCLVAAIWAYPTLASCPSCDHVMDLDFIEMYGNPGPYASGGSPAGATGTISGYNPAVWNTIDFLDTVANSGSPNDASCWWINGQLITSPCPSATYSSADLGDWLDVYPGTSGPLRTGYNCGKGGNQTCSPLRNQVQLLQRVTIWQCPSYRNGPCFTNGVITNP
jgi:hypothetical protein